MFLVMSLKVVYVICSLFCTTQYFQELCLTKSTNFLFLQFSWFFNLDKFCTSFQVVQHGYKLFQMSTCCFDQGSRWMSPLISLTFDYRRYENRYYLSCDGILIGLIDFTVRIDIASGWMNTEHSQLLRSIPGL